MRAPYNSLLAAGILGLPGALAAPAPGFGSFLKPATGPLTPPAFGLDALPTPFTASSTPPATDSDSGKDSVQGLSTSPAPGLASFLNPITGSLETLTDGLVQTSLGPLEGVLGEAEEYDYVVVGGGTGGNTVAYRLAAEGYTVAVIEAGGSYEIGKPVLGTAPLGDIIGVGGNPLDSIPTVDYGLVTEPQPGAGGRSLHYAQGRCLGGSSGLNFMVYHRPTRGSLDLWADSVGDDSYRFDDFLPYMQKSFNFDPGNNVRPADAYHASDFTAGGPLQITYSKWLSDWAPWAIKGFEALGIKMTTTTNQGELNGWHYTQTTIKAREQVRSTSAEFIYQAKRENMQKKLKVYLGTRAEKILFDADKRATGVKVQGLLPFTLKAKKEVILSAGAFFSPQLLMLSGVGPKDELAKLGIDVVADRPGVGQNLTDQPLFGVSYEVSGVKTLSEVLGNPVVLAKALVDYITKQAGPLTSNVAEILAWGRLPSNAKVSKETVDAIDSVYPQDWPYFEYVPVAGYIGRFDIPFLDQPKDGKQYSALMGILVAPLSRGRVSLKGTNPATPPAIDPAWLTDPADMEVAVAAYRQLRAFYTTDAVKSKRPNDAEKYPGLENETDEQVIAKIRDSMMTIYHASCTNRMGRRDDPTAVVDARARVIGVDGLRVVDASAFALLPPGHPQSVVYALAEKIADDIIKGAKA